ncbi:hypothetical protein P3T37_001478 [Kitasatospora sp. MAA4]|nr:hypothetical protein [Kitasatospora sp. MAA4]
MDESVIRRSVGDPQAMSRQIAYMLEMSYLPNVNLRIVPFGPHPAVGPQGMMAFLELPNARRWFYTESLEYGSCNNDPIAVAKQWRSYDRIQAQALSAPDTRQLLRRAQEELIAMNRRPIEPSSVSWFKASYSTGSNGGCVEISADLLSSGYVPIRDSKDPEGPNPLLPTPAFAAFREAVKAGEFAYGERYLRP